MTGTYAVGSLVSARGREWVILPESSQDLVMVRPLGGTEDEVTGILTDVEEVRAATFAPPDPEQVGDDRSARLLRDALRLGFRSSAGPFRSFGRLNVEPRPYQLVPLLMALRQSPVRLLIADDVGIGKTVEAALIARELLDQGEVSRSAVICPPQLAEQWQQELHEKFHIEAELVLPSTAARLERGLRNDQTIFDVDPFTVVSLDYIKGERRRGEFVRTCPELVIVDEAHTCADSGPQGSGQHQRHRLIADLAKDPDRHLLLVTATPHSGDENAFRSLLELLDPSFADLPQELSGREHEADRRRLAQHFVQRRRGDIRRYLERDTSFPEREEAEETYTLSAAYRQVFERVFGYAREQVRDRSGTHHRQRVRWWSALALLRCVASSPAAAAATLRARADTIDTQTAQEADLIGELTVLDEGGAAGEETVDTTPGTDPTPVHEESAVHRRLLELAREAEALTPEDDVKLQRAMRIVARLLDDGSNPIIFCRFIPTARYVADALRARFGSRVQVEAVTGALPPAEREARVAQLQQAEKRILVATDCLSEGINLQQGFDAVIHYDLSWNPTRHEQREGRVDRFGQRKPKVRVVTYYGTDNQIDGIVLDVLIRKHKAIRKATGVAVPVPGSSSSVVEAIVEGLLLRGPRAQGEQLTLLPDALAPAQQDLLLEWDQAADRERRSRTMFAQETIRPEEVWGELEASRDAVGDETDMAGFLRTVVEASGGTVTGDGVVRLHLEGASPALAEIVRHYGKDAQDVAVTFETGRDTQALLLSRTHPLVDQTASWVLTTALDPEGRGPARRCGVIRTSGVRQRTTLLLLRRRFHLVVEKERVERPLLAEDSALIAYTGSALEPVWLAPPDAERLLGMRPSANLAREQRVHFARQAAEALPLLTPHLEKDAKAGAEALLQAHRGVRAAARERGVRFRVEPNLPPDVLGVFVYLPEVAR